MLNKHTSEFLKNVCGQIKYKKIHKDISNELVVHIDEMKDEYIKKGMAEDEAVEKAVEQMGDPIEIGMNLNKTHKPKIEWSIIILISMMVVSGGIVLLSLASDVAFSTSIEEFIKSYLLYTVLGVGLLLAFYFFDYTKLEKYSLHIFLASIVFLLVTPYFPRSNVYDHIMIGPINFSPMSITMPLLLISFSGILTRWMTGNIEDILKISGLAILAILMGLIQGSIVNTFILICGFLVMTTVAIIDKSFKGNKKVFLFYTYGSLVSAVVGFLIFYIRPHRYRVERLTTFLNPSKDTTGNGYIYIQIQKVLSEAKILGKGDGLYLNHNEFTVPSLESHFIFTYIVSAFGWIAGITIVIISLLTIIRMLFTIKKIHSTYGKYIMSSIITVFSLQIVANILMNLGLFPTIGIPLPFISYGGTNFVTNMGLIGLLLGIYRRKDLILSSK